MHIPGAKTACEAAEASTFFDQRFHGAIAIGLLFLLPEERQHALIERVSRALYPGGHFLFNAPRHASKWNDTLTGRQSISLGEKRYGQLLSSVSCRLVGSYVDEGSNYYFHAVSESA